MPKARAGKVSRVGVLQIHQCYHVPPGNTNYSKLREQLLDRQQGATQDGQVVSLRTFTIPPSTATDEQVERIRRESMA